MSGYPAACMGFYNVSLWTVPDIRLGWFRVQKMPALCGTYFQIDARETEKHSE